MADKAILDEETQKKIEDISSSIAEKQANEAPPDPLHPKELLKKQIQLETQAKITEFFENFTIGVRELVYALIEVEKSDPSIKADVILSQLEKLGEVLSAMAENPVETKSPREVCGFTEETMKVLDRAVATIYESKEYEKASAVYTFLSYLDPGESTYWVGYGNSEFFLAHYSNALKGYETAVANAPDYVPYQFYLAHCYKELKQIDKAIDIVDQSLENIKKNSSPKEWKETAEQLKAHLKSIAH
jgi:tetratricopeptide (TPR) repeat protein